MKISYNWLKSYIDGELPNPTKLEEVLTFKLCEVESVVPVMPGDEPASRDTGEHTLDSGSEAGMTEKAEDWIFDVNILPNRAHDLLSHQGMAREIAGILGMKFKSPVEMYKVPESQPTNLQVSIESDACRRYMGRIIRNVAIGPSPDWVVKHLESIGQRSINNIVDATNLVMYDCGQPCHAFDAKKLASEKIVIRAAQAGEKITTLSGQEIELRDTDSVIADSDKSLAIAGVKGGTAAEVDAQTTDIVIEIANFDPVAVRKTARRLNLLTDSAKRFENDLLPDHAAYAMRELSAMILEMCPGAVFEDIVDEYPNPQQPRTLEFSVSWINAQLGTNLSADEMVKILTDYGYEISGAGDTRTLSVHALRLDLTGQHDIAEEVLRLYGLENIAAVPLALEKKPTINPTMYQMLAARKKLLAEGYRETMTYSFRKKGVFEVARGVGDKSALRTNLSDGLKESFEMNKLNAPLLGIDTLKLFEIGSVFPASGEVVHIALADKNNVVEMTLEEWCQQNGIVVGNSYDEVLPASSASEAPFKQWSPYPFIVRDVALWVPNSVSVNDVLAIMESAKPSLATETPRLFDTFQKDGRTSYAFRLIFQAPDRTLTDAEVDAEFGPFVETLKAQGWEVR